MASPLTAEVFNTLPKAVCFISSLGMNADKKQVELTFWLQPLKRRYPGLLLDITGSQRHGELYMPGHYRAHLNPVCHTAPSGLG